MSHNRLAAFGVLSLGRGVQPSQSEHSPSKSGAVLVSKDRTDGSTPLISFRVEREQRDSPKNANVLWSFCPVPDGGSGEALSWGLVVISLCSASSLGLACGGMVVS